MVGVGQRWLTATSIEEGPTVETAVPETDESEYIREAEVNEERKETRLQGLKDRFAVSDDPEAEVLRQEVERLEQEIEDLTGQRVQRTGGKRVRSPETYASSRVSAGMTNWRAVGIGFTIELFLGLVGLLAPGIGQLVAGLVGGFVAGYIGSTTVRSGLWHGLLAGSLGGFLLAIPVGILVAVASVGIDLTTQFGGLVVGVGTTMLVLLVATILGANSAIGGAIGGLVKGRDASGPNTHPETVVHRERHRATTAEGEHGRAVANPNREESPRSPKLTDVIQNQR